MPTPLCGMVFSTYYILIDFSMHNPDATMRRDSVFALNPFDRMHSGHKFKQWYQSGVNHGCWQYENSCSSALRI